MDKIDRPSGIKQMILNKRAHRNTVKQIVLCPVCQRGDVWHEAVSRTQYVYKGEAVKDGQEVIDYLLAEVAALLETQNADLSGGEKKE